uniref:Beta-defensin n=1 Tax=Catagonus wagneri TaxID=51154 RepID=A0A8C3WHM1_9CETA
MKNLLGKQKTDFGNICEQDQGSCRKKCRTQEAELHYCANGKKCCMKSYSTIITHVVEEKINWPFWATTSQPSY